MVISSVQVRRDRSDFWEGIKAHNATVTCAIFAPNPEAIIKSENDEDNISRSSVVTVSYSYMFNWAAFYICLYFLDSTQQFPIRWPNNAKRAAATC